MNVMQKLERAEMNRLRKEDSYFRTTADVKTYRKRTVWDHITRVSLFIICFLIGGALGYIFFSGLFFYAIKIVTNLK